MALYITPFGQLIRRRMMNAMVDDLQGDAEAHFSLPLNVKANEEGYTLTAVLPGVKAEELTVEVKQRTVIIEGVLPDDGGENDQYLLRERPFGKFSRTVRLPEQVDPSRIEAQLKDGILTLQVPKVEEARPRRIKVNLN